MKYLAVNSMTEMLNLGKVQKIILFCIGKV